MIKVMGAAIVIAAGTSWGFYKAKRYIERPRELQALMAGLQILETEILYAATPLPQALSRIGKQLPGRVGPFFLRWAESLSTGSGRSPVQILEEDWERITEGMHLMSSDREPLIQWSMTLGQSDRTDQSKHIRVVYAALSAQEGQAREEMSKMAKLWRYTGVLAASAVVLLLY